MRATTPAALPDCLVRYQDRVDVTMKNRKRPSPDDSRMPSMSASPPPKLPPLPRSSLHGPKRTAYSDVSRATSAPSSPVTLSLATLS
ncbi:hypothetical protein HGRIS_001453 [Hohenbuehelia grisea]|uniref:Uncharacterized protein n=1 Tax=Hohenbuehelia grisea TaxID=104357 RepID=A0ABR3JPJ1_9AGAR